jgi:hypothetical protein
MSNDKATKYCLNFWDTTVSCIYCVCSDQKTRADSEDHLSFVSKCFRTNRKRVYYRVEDVEYIFYRITSAGGTNSKSFTPGCPIQALRYV